MIGDIFFALWFFLPAGLANAAPVFASRMPVLARLNIPIDAGRHFRGKRIFGDHKTVRGFFAGVFVAAVTGLIQYFAYGNIAWIRHFSLVSYDSVSKSIMLGVVLGFGALLGDAVKSFFKRQFSVPSGKAWFPFDQVDYIVGGLLFSSIIIDLPHSAYWWMGFIWFLIHPIATFFAWLLGLKDSPI